jgi:hypothetical protein
MTRNLDVPEKIIGNTRGCFDVVTVWRIPQTLENRRPTDPGRTADTAAKAGRDHAGEDIEPRPAMAAPQENILGAEKKKAADLSCRSDGVFVTALDRKIVLNIGKRVHCRMARAPLRCRYDNSSLLRQMKAGTWLSMRERSDIR